MGAADPAPGYCSWYGISCCSQADQRDGSCSNVHAVSAIDLKVNRVNITISEPDELDSLEGLHASGLLAVNLEGNNVSGTLAPRWGKFDHLTSIRIGERACDRGRF